MSDFDRRFSQRPSYGPTTTAGGSEDFHNPEYEPFERTHDFSGLRSDFDARRRAMEARMHDDMNRWHNDVDQRQRSGSQGFRQPGGPSLFDEAFGSSPNRQRAGSARFDRDPWRSEDGQTVREIPIKVQVVNSNQAQPQSQSQPQQSAQRQQSPFRRNMQNGNGSATPIQIQVQPLADQEQQAARSPNIPIVLPMSESQAAELERQRQQADAERRAAVERLREQVVAEQKRTQAEADHRQRLQQADAERKRQQSGSDRDIPIKVQILHPNECSSSSTTTTTNASRKSPAREAAEEEKPAERRPDVPIVLQMTPPEQSTDDGKSVFEDEKLLSELKLKDGDKVMVLGKKPETETDQPYLRLVEFEKKSLSGLDEQSSAIANDLAGLEQGFLNGAQLAEQLKVMDKRLKQWHEDCMRLLEKLDAFELADDKTSEAQRVTNRQKRKSIVTAIEKHLHTHDQLEERRKKLVAGIAQTSPTGQPAAAPPKSDNAPSKQKT